MKITAGRRDDIIRERDAFDADRAQRKAKQDAQYNEYHEAVEAICLAVQSEVEDRLSAVQGLDLQVHVSTAGFGVHGLRVDVQSNQFNVHDKNKALSWDWKCHLDENGEVVKETGSWSGLQAVNETQLESLRKSVTALEILNSIDWTTMLNKELPQWRDYVELDPKLVEPRPNFEQQIVEAELEEGIGQRKLFKAKSGAGKYYRGAVYFGIEKETPAMYYVFEIPEMYIKEVLDGTSRHFDSIEGCVDHFSVNTSRVKKDAFISGLVKPVDVIEY